MHEFIVPIIFYFFAGLTVVSALLVITQNNPVRCVLFLVLAFFCSAVLWLIMEAEFLALILILVYVGAVMTLFLFVVMMLNIDLESMRSHFLKYLPFGLLLVGGFVGLFASALPKTFMQAFPPEKADIHHFAILEGIVPVTNPSNTQMISAVLYTDYVFPLEIAAVILLVAIIAAITLVHRETKRSKRQDVTKQIMTRRADRIKLVKMKSEH